MSFLICTSDVEVFLLHDVCEVVLHMVPYLPCLYFPVVLFLSTANVVFSDVLSKIYMTITAISVFLALLNIVVVTLFCNLLGCCCGESSYDIPSQPSQTAMVRCGVCPVSWPC